jgi:hypothetical protein
MTDPVTRRIASIENSAAPQIDSPISTGWAIPLLSDDEYSLLLGQANYADNTFTGTWLNSESYDDYPYDSPEAQSLRTKLMGAILVDTNGCCIPGAPGDVYNQIAYGNFYFGPNVEPPILGGGTRPPGYPPNDDYINDPTYTNHPGTDPFTGHVDMVCADNLVVNDHGTNHTGNLRDYGMPDFPSLFANLLPVNDLLHDHIPIKDAIDAKITADGHLPLSAVVKTVYLGYNGSWCDSGHAGFFMSDVTGAGVDLFNFRATRPHLQLATLTAATETELDPTRLIQLADVEIGGSWSDNIKAGLKAIAGICEDGKKTLTAYDKLHEIFLSCRMPPCTPNIFFSNSDSPVLEICVTGYDYSLIVGAWAGHFNLQNTAQYIENPHVSGQIVFFSDTPNGLVTGQSADNYSANLWTDPGVVADVGNVILVSTGISGRIQEAILFEVADGYTLNADGAYTKIHLKLYGMWGAQTLNLRVSHSISGGSNYSITTGDIGNPFSRTYTLATYETVIDISSDPFVLGAPGTVHVGLSGGFFLQAWEIAFMP